MLLWLCSYALHERNAPVKEEDQTIGSAPVAHDDSDLSLGARLLRVAWLAILLGLAMELLLLLVATSFGNLIGFLGGFTADLVQNVTWSVVVCLGIAVGTAVARAQIPLMGILGMLSAPLALEVSRAFHKGAQQALLIVDSAPVGEPSPVLIALVKGIEYGCLGLLVAWLWRRPWGGMLAHVGVGLLVGGIFGGVVLALVYEAAPQAPATAFLVSRGVNEIIFPVGCALVLYSAGAMGRRMANQEAR